VKKRGTFHAPKRDVVGAVTLALWLAVSNSPAAASAVVDQAFVEGDNLGAVISDGCRYVGQSFTAGVTGRLTEVNVDVRTHLISGVHPMRIAIRTAWRSKPYGDPLGFAYVGGDALLGRLIAFEQDIQVVAGRQYAIVVSYRGAPLGGAEVSGQWNGATEDLYPRGRLFFGECPTSNSPTLWVLRAAEASYDVHFRTYVDAS
jgi:hypothetical protein